MVALTTKFALGNDNHGLAAAGLENFLTGGRVRDGGTVQLTMGLIESVESPLTYTEDGESVVFTLLDIAMSEEKAKRGIAAKQWDAVGVQLLGLPENWRETFDRRKLNTIEQQLRTSTRAAVAVCKLCPSLEATFIKGSGEYILDGVPLWSLEYVSPMTKADGTRTPLGRAIFACIDEYMQRGVRGYVDYKGTEYTEEDVESEILALKVSTGDPFSMIGGSSAKGDVPPAATYLHDVLIKYAERKGVLPSKSKGKDDVSGMADRESILEALSLLVNVSESWLPDNDESPIALGDIEASTKIMALLANFMKVPETGELLVDAVRAAGFAVTPKSE